MITFIEAFKKELEQEAIQTKRMLEIIPKDKMDWQAHPKSMSIKRLATHIAEIPEMISNGLKSDKWDFAANPYAPKEYKTAKELVDRFEECVAEAQNALSNASEDILQEQWTLCAGEKVFLTMEKWETIRHAFGQNAHHRAQLGVYLRLLDIAIPGPYGPSADESF